jgi:hypothetical protein
VELIRPRQGCDQQLSSDDELMLCRGWPLPGYPGLQWGQSSMHKLLRRWKRHRPDVLYIATEGPLGLSALRAARRLGISVVSGFHTNFQQYSHQYGLGLLTRLLTHYLRWFHNRSTMTLVPSVSQSANGAGTASLRAPGAAFPRGRQPIVSPSKRLNALREQWGLAEEDIAVIHVGRLAREKTWVAQAHLRHPQGQLSTAHPEADRGRRWSAAPGTAKRGARGDFLRHSAR